VQDSSQPVLFDPAHNEIHFYTWGNSRCCLPKGATSATLADQWVPIDGGRQGAPQPSPTAPAPAGATTAPPLSVGAAVSAPAPRFPSAPAPAPAVPTPAGSTSDGPPGTVRLLHLQVGDVVIFE